MAVTWIIGIFGIALYFYALTLPPDKPERHCHKGTDRVGHRPGPDSR